MALLLGFSAPTDGCACDICRVLRSHNDDIETRDTLPPMPVTIAEKTSAVLLAEIRAALGGGGW